MRRTYLPVLAIALLHHVLLPVAIGQRNAISLVRSGNFLFAPVSINRSPINWWLLDTGAPVSEIDVEAAKALHLLHISARIRNSAGDIASEEQTAVQAASFGVGSFPTGGTKLVTKTLTELNHSSLPVGWFGAFNRTGLIGMDLLLRQNAIVDWSSQQIILAPTSDPGRTRTTYEREGFTYIPLSVTPENHLEVVGRLGNSEYRFYIDTGNPKTLLKQSVVEAENLPSEITQAEVHSPLHNFENTKVRSVMATGLQLGNFDMGGQKVHSASFNLSDTERGPTWAGLIGADTLWSYDTILDFGKRALYLRAKPSVRNDSPAVH